MSKRNKLDKLSERAIEIRNAIDKLSISTQEAIYAVHAFTETCSKILPLVSLPDIDNTFSAN